MEKENYLIKVDQLLSLEKSLNKILFNGVPIGGLFSKLLFGISKNDLKKFNKQKYFFVFIITSLSFKNYFSRREFGKKNTILFIRLTNRINRKKLIDPFALAFEHICTLFSSSPTYKSNNYLFKNLPSLSFKDTVSILVQAIRLYPKVKKEFKNWNVECDGLIIFNTLLGQLFKLNTCINIFEGSSYKLVVCDFDRNDLTNHFVLAAKKFKIKTISLLHGAIYPPYGYVPLLVDEIWCWGSLQKQLLEAMNVESKKICIVGNPVAERSFNESDYIEKLKEEYDLQGKIVIGIALNAIGFDNNQKLVNFLLNSSDEFQAFVIFVKLYPSMTVKDLSTEVIENSRIRIFEHRKYSNEIYFGLCDLLFSRGSSLSYDAIINDLPVAMIDLDDMESNKGNMEVMVEYGGCPIFGSVDKLIPFFKAFADNISEGKRVLLESQKKFVSETYYYKIGQDAIEEITSRIKNELSKDYSIVPT